MMAYLISSDSQVHEPRVFWVRDNFMKFFRISNKRNLRFGSSSFGNRDDDRSKIHSSVPVPRLDKSLVVPAVRLHPDA